MTWSSIPTRPSRPASRIWLPATVFLLVILPLCVRAQEPAQQLELRVRLRSAGPDSLNWLMGQVVRQTKDSVVLQVAGQGDPARVAWADVSAAAFRGRGGSHARAGALIGGGVGLGLVALALTDTEMFSDTAPLPVVFATAVLVPAGLGALLGSAIRRQRWWPYNPPRVSLRGDGNGRWLVAVDLRR